MLFLVFYNGEGDYPEKKHVILTKCRVLREYSQFVETTRKYREDGNKLEKAVKECIENGILSEYLTRKSYEVVNMLMAEYDYEMDMEVKCEEAAEKAAKKAAKKAEQEANQKFIEYVENIAKSFDVSVEDACKRMGEPYEKYVRIKKNLS